MFALPVLELKGLTAPAALVSGVQAYNTEHADEHPGIPLETVTGQRHLEDLVSSTWPALFDLSSTIRSLIGAGPGAVVIRGLGFEAHDESTRASLLLALTAAIGSPTDHATDRRVLWPIRERPSRPNRVVTFSERTGEAPFHTDSAFAAEPELYNGLYVIQKAGCGGGVSRLQSIAAVLERLAAAPDGEALIEKLFTLRYAFHIPEAFYRAGPRVVIAPILTDGPRIRFRPDSIQNGFKLVPELATDEHRRAFEAIWEAIETNDRVLEYMLDDGEFIVFDNHRLLHARGDYTDPARHLVRIRMAERARAVAAMEMPAAAAAE